MSVQEKRVLSGNEHTDMVNELTKLQIWHGDYEDEQGLKLARRSGQLVGDLKVMRISAKLAIDYLRKLNDPVADVYAGGLQRDLEQTEYVNEETRIYKRRDT